MSELPSGWVRQTLSDVIASDGLFTDGDWVETKDQDASGGVRLTQLADVGDGYFRDRSRRYMRDDQAEQLNCTYLAAGDVLVARMPDPLGRACLFPQLPQPAVTAVDVCIVRPGDRSVDGKWLMWAINAPQFRARIDSLQTGTTRRRISRKNLASIPLPVPPLAEQQRIVAVIEEQFSRLETASRGIATCRARVNALEERLRRDAVTPRAVWESLTFEQGFSSVSDGGRKVKRRDYLDDGDFPVVDQGEEPVGGYTNDESVLYDGALPVLLFGDHTRRFKLMGEPFAVGADGVKLIAPRAGWDIRFAQLALSAANLPDRGYSRHFQFLRKTVIGRPPLEDQRRIVAELEQQLSLIDALRAAVESAQKRSAALRRAILERAFRGELVPQDPADEPASVLLERIRADRAAAPARASRGRATMEAS